MTATVKHDKIIFRNVANGAQHEQVTGCAGRSGCQVKATAYGTVLTVTGDLATFAQNWEKETQG